MSDPLPVAASAAGEHQHNSSESTTTTTTTTMPGGTHQEGVVTIGHEEASCRQDVTTNLTTTKDDAAGDHHQHVYENITVKDIDVDGNENPVGINGIRWEQMPVRHLRIICSKLSSKGVKNAKKAFIIETLTRWCRNKWNYDAMMASYDNATTHTTTTSTNTNATGAAPSKRKEVQCTFRLMNILFSDDFASDFASLGNVASKESLDSGKAGNNQRFGERVKDAFMEPNNDDYDRLFFMDDDVFAAQSHINPSRIVNHDWKKLRMMWKSVNSDYKNALTRFTVSGTHDSNFFGFCAGKLEPYYLRMHVQNRPDLTSMVEAGLPHECFLASEMSVAEMREKVCGTQGRISLSSTIAMAASTDTNSSCSGTEQDTNRPSAKKKPCRNNTSSSSSSVGHQTNSDSRAEKVAEAIRDLANAKMQAELAKNKLRYMENEDSRRGHELLLYEWKEVQNGICMLHDQLERKNIDSRTEADLLNDIEGLLIRKDELAESLQFVKK